MNETKVDFSTELAGFWCERRPWLRDFWNGLMIPLIAIKEECARHCEEADLFKSLNTIYGR